MKIVREHDRTWRAWLLANMAWITLIAVVSKVDEDATRVLALCGIPLALSVWFPAVYLRLRKK